MPELLTGMTEAILTSWFVQPGDAITLGLPLAEIETDKALVEYEAEVEGVLAERLVEPGQTVAVGTPIAVVAEGGESAHTAMIDSPGQPPATAEHTAPVSPSAAPDDVGTPKDVLAPPPSPMPPPGDVTPDAATPEEPARRFASPLVRRLAKERGLDLNSVRGSGPNGRIVKSDIVALRHPEPEVIESPAITEEHRPSTVRNTQKTSPDSAFVDIPLTPMRRAIARRLAESKATIPHFYLEADCRVDDLLDLRRTVNEHSPVKISINDFVVKAAAAALRAVPAVNASWAGDAIRQFHAIDIAVAVALDSGLVTPVIRDVGRRSLTDVGRTISDLAERGRANQLKQHELEGGAFCISNLGMYGTKRLSAIINPPQSGILAVGVATERALVVNGELTIGTVMSVTLSGDHRVYDGATGAQWLATFVEHIENPITILI